MLQAPCQQPREIATVAARRCHFGEAGNAHRLRAVLADREYGQKAQLGETLVPDHGLRRIGAGDKDCRPWSGADLGMLQRLYAKKWRHNRAMPSRA